MCKATQIHTQNDSTTRDSPVGPPLAPPLTKPCVQQHLLKRLKVNKLRKYQVLIQTTSK
jgi:hypothetical protein